jgi:hypothetical protein
MSPKRLSIDREAYFPNLQQGQYKVTSSETPEYNCIAHAAGAANDWWWPAEPPAYWPDGIAKEETLQSFMLAYQEVGYVKCEAQGRELEHGVEKVAIYVDCDGVPTHAARQLADGTWTSKLGEWEDIQHDTLEAMEDREDLGLGYGKVGLLLRRQRR